MKRKTVFCIGAALVDEIYHSVDQPVVGSSNPSSYVKTPGGVARNIAHHLALLGDSVELISHFGNDPDGDWLMKKCSESGIGISHSLINTTHTGKFAAFIAPEGELITGAVSTHFEELITPEFLQSKAPLLKEASVVLFDCNLSVESMQWLTLFCQEQKIPYIIEPVSVTKAERLLQVDIQNTLLITPNEIEMAKLSVGSNDLSAEILIGNILKKGVHYVWVRKGKAGSVLHTTNNQFVLKAPSIKVMDSTGAGDAALAGWIHAWLMSKHPEDCVRYGHALASLVLQVKGAILEKADSKTLQQIINAEN